MDHHHDMKCKIVVVGDTQCGKTSLLNVFAKDSFPEVCREKSPININVNLIICVMSVTFIERFSHELVILFG